MADYQQKRIFFPSKRRLFISMLARELPQVAFAFIAIMVIVRAEIMQVVIYFLVFCILALWRFRNRSKKLFEQSAITVSAQDIHGFPDTPLFNGFRAVEKVRIPFNKIDKDKTGTLKAGRWWSGNFIWSTDGQNIVLSNDFAEEQLREIAGLIGCPIE